MINDFIKKIKYIIIEHVEHQTIFVIPFKIAYKLYLIISKPYYTFGKQHYCTVCDHSARLFIRDPIAQNEFRCPNCYSLERHRLLGLYKNKVFFTGNKKMLHFAPEECVKKVFSDKKNIDYLSADLDRSKAMIEMDIQNIQFPENSFDLIICNHVLEHIPNDQKAMNELYRVLKPRGWAFLTVPINYKSETTFEDPAIFTPEQRIENYGQADHLRVYGLDFREKLNEAGFIVTVDNRLDTMADELKSRYCLNKKEYLYLCTKE